MFKSYRQRAALLVIALLTILTFTASAAPVVKAVPAAFNLQYPIQGQIILDTSQILYFQWEEAVGATDYFIAILEVLDGNDEEVIQENGTAIADGDPITCFDGFCQFDLTPTDQDKLFNNADFLWNVNASNVDGPTPQTNEFGFQVRETDSLLINSNFEVDEDATPSTPDFWTVKNSTSDKVKCNKQGKIVAGEGECAFQFAGGVGESSKIQQSPVIDGIGTEDKLFISAMIATKNVVEGGKLTLKIKYLDDQVPTSKFVVTVDPGTAAYDQFASDEQIVTSEPKKIIVQASYSGVSGKWWVDNLRLSFEDAPVVLHLPPAQ